MDYSLLMAELESHPSREYWENRLDERANAIPISERPDWVNSLEFDDFVEAWFDLRQFYVRYTDTVMGVDAFAAFVDFMRLLRLMITDQNLDSALREKAQDRMADLEGAMLEIIREAGGNLNNRAT